MKAHVAIFYIKGKSVYNKIINSLNILTLQLLMCKKLENECAFCMVYLLFFVTKLSFIGDYTHTEK